MEEKNEDREQFQPEKITPYAGPEGIVPEGELDTVEAAKTEEIDSQAEENLTPVEYQGDKKLKKLKKKLSKLKQKRKDLKTKAKKARKKGKKKKAKALDKKRKALKARRKKLRAAYQEAKDLG